MVDPLEAMVEVLVAAGPFAYGTDQKLTQTAQEWLDMGFGHDEANDWLSVRCFHASVARDFANEDLEPDDLDITTPKPYPDTLLQGLQQRREVRGRREGGQEPTGVNRAQLAWQRLPAPIWNPRCPCIGGRARSRGLPGDPPGELPVGER